MLFSPEQELIRDTARDFAQQRIAPFAGRWETEGFDRRKLLNEVGQLGLMGVCVPEEWGGAGADFVSYVLATEEIAAADSGICNMINVHNSPVCAALCEYGTPEQKETYLRPLARGEIFGAFLLTEPEAGSDAGALKTRAALVGDHYVLNGAKQFITAGRTADIAMILAVTDPEAGRKGISCFITPTDNPGYIVVREEDKLGHRNCDTCQIAFQDMKVPASDVLGEPGAGYKIALSNLNSGRIGVAAQAVGVARAALDCAVRYARERRTFGKAIIDHQAVGFKLAEMATQVEAAHRLTLYAAELKDAGLPCLKEASMAKLQASEVAERVCSDAIQVHGGYGFLNDFPVEKFYRDARVFRLYEGTSEVQKLVIGREL
ncbi:MAG TPA: acyl-CoA dehydrogenase [Afipia sp.]|nr:acyl-CoA dehydrogenase [Afipia sp.]OUX62617.1 MAG: acyl-CoA dehydrogenase [Afipia sp. TMED4]HAO40032.1 acyl-CoA dehydrogenase [Afipia sp.]HAP11878.1 acyl-CoA dehydrogenase [Afipia sp.]HBF55870.1 acyl-CoA dehydrogenase [Afipia sp.]